MQKKLNQTLSLLVIIGLWTLLAASCKKKEELISLPEISTSDITNVLKNTGTTGGNITSDGGEIITARGVCWDTLQNPTINKNFTTNGEGSGSFISEVTNLKSGKKYYLRAYATNNNGTAYGSIIIFTTMDSTIADVDGNVYKTIQIGKQIWMAENLKTTKLNDNTLLGDLANNPTNNPKMFSWFQYDTNYKHIYGAYYNAAAKNSGKLSPKGWRIPTTNDWNILINYLGGSAIAGGKMKITGTQYWNSQNIGATNESGFSALGGGHLHGDTEATEAISYEGSWWIFDTNLRLTLYANNSGVVNSNTPAYGWDIDQYAVRCIKD